MRDVQKVDGEYGKQGVRDEFVAFIFDRGQSSFDLLGCPKRFPRFVEVTQDKRNPVCAINDALLLVQSLGVKYHFRTFGYEPLCGVLPHVPGLQTVNVPKNGRYPWIMEWLLRNTPAKEFAWAGADGADTSKCPDKYLATWLHVKRIDANPNIQVVHPGCLMPSRNGGWEQVGRGATSDYDFKELGAPSWPQG